MKKMILIFSLLLSSVAFSQVEQEVDSFGGNEALYLKARALNPDVESNVIQNRFINRQMRLELAPEFSGVSGGDAYNRTSNAGINAHFHINPKFSIGVKYSYSFNTLTPEGTAMVARATDAAKVNPKNPNYLFPQVIFPKSEVLGLVNWYPIVGKLSFGRFGVAHFDTYLIGGMGNVELSNASTSTTTFGAGMGFWLNSHLTTRLEYRTQQYKAEYYDKTEDMNVGIGSVQMGWIL
jgi:outer membrane beta-barrel protein